MAKLVLKVPDKIVLGRRSLMVALILIAAAIILPIIYISHKNQRTNNALLESGQTSTAQLQLLESKIGAHLLLPSDEQPTLATITNPSKLQDQPFFNGAQAGDKVLVYARSQKAILYRPATGKIISVGHLGVSL